MYIDTVLLLHDVPTLDVGAGGTVRDIRLGLTSDGTFLVGQLPAYLECGLYVEAVADAGTAGDAIIDVYAMRVDDDRDMWLLGSEIVTVTAADASWKHPRSFPSAFAVWLDIVEKDDDDLRLLVAVNGDVIAMRSIIIRPQAPDTPQPVEQP